MHSYLAIPILASVATAAPEQSHGAESVDAHVLALVRAFNDARARYDAAALDRRLAPDYVEVSPRGEIDLRKAVLGFYAPEKAMPTPPMTLSTQWARRYGDVAIVLGSVDFSAPGSDGVAIKRTLRTTYVGRRIRGRWLMASTHYTGVAGDSTAPRRR